VISAIELLSRHAFILASGDTYGVGKGR
jgi:hypothetical protein